MPSTRVNDALNAEIGLEFFAHLQYVAMAVYFESRSLDKLAAFFYNQAEEEKTHALMIIKYLVETDGVVNIPAIEQPKQEFASALELAQLFLDQEKHVTDQFYRMNAMALEDGDYISQNFLQWFIAEQREEMATASRLIDLIRMAGDNLLLVEMSIASLEAGQASSPAAAAG